MSTRTPIAAMEAALAWLDAIARENPSGRVHADTIRQAITAALAARPGVPEGRLRGIIERERTAACHWIEAARKTLNSHRWVTGSRGSYEWNDTEFYKEALHLFKALDMILENAERETKARDFTDCPTTQAEVEAARSGVPGDVDARARLLADQVSQLYERAAPWEKCTESEREDIRGIVRVLCLPASRSGVEPAPVLSGDSERTLNAMAADVHTANKKWWYGPDGARLNRNKGELLMLVVTEVAEAMEGERKDLMDDKLPHRKMAEVEVVDAIVRLLDYAAAYGYDLDGAYREKMAYNASREDHKREAALIAAGKQFDASRAAIDHARGDV